VKLLQGVKESRSKPRAPIGKDVKLVKEGRRNSRSSLKLELEQKHVSKIRSAD